MGSMLFLLCCYKNQITKKKNKKQKKKQNKTKQKQKKKKKNKQKKNDPCKQHEELEQGMALAVSQGGQIVWKRNKPKQSHYFNTFVDYCFFDF